MEPCCALHAKGIAAVRDKYTPCCGTALPAALPAILPASEIVGPSLKSLSSIKKALSLAPSSFLSSLTRINSSWTDAVPTARQHNAPGVACFTAEQELVARGRVPSSVPAWVLSQTYGECLLYSSSESGKFKSRSMPSRYRDYFHSMASQCHAHTTLRNLLKMAASK